MIKVVGLYQKFFWVLFWCCFFFKPSFAFDVATLRLGDHYSSFEALTGPAKEFLTVTHGPSNRIVRIYYRQEGLPADEITQKIIVNRICEKYGFAPACRSQIESIESGEDVQFFQLYLKPNEQVLRSKITVDTGFLKGKTLTLEIDLMNTEYEKALAGQTGGAVNHSSAFVLGDQGAKLLSESTKQSRATESRSETLVQIELTKVEMGSANGVIGGRIDSFSSDLVLLIDGEKVKPFGSALGVTSYRSKGR
jgi:hypothetical protein